MAPESIRDKRYDHSSDCFSLATLMWECFSWGDQPFANLSNLEAVLAVGTGRRLARPNACPKPVYALMKQMWSLSPGERPIFAAVLHTLRHTGVDQDTMPGGLKDHAGEAAFATTEGLTEPASPSLGSSRYISDDQTASIGGSGKTITSQVPGSMAHYVSFGAGGLASAPALSSTLQLARLPPHGDVSRSTMPLPAAPIDYRVSTAV